MNHLQNGGSLADQVRAHHTRLTRALNAYTDKVLTHPHVLAVTRHPTTRRAWQFAQEHKLFDALCRLMVGMYFINMAYYSLDLYWNYNFSGTETIDFFALLRFPVAACYIANFRVDLMAPVLVAFSSWDVLRIFHGQISRAITGQAPFTINELMMKKFSIFGVCLLLIVEKFKGKIVFTGDIINPAAKDAKSRNQNIILLLARLSISAMFLYIGVMEVYNQLHTVGHWYSSTQGKSLLRPPGDGHDQLSFKLLELFFGVPIAFGYSGGGAPAALAFVLVLEAFVQWNFWGDIAIRGWRYYPVHARDHFYTNCAVAGGLLMLAGIGVGKYSVDSWLKKKE